MLDKCRMRFLAFRPCLLVDDMELALLDLQSVEDCEVSRTPAGSAGQHVWAVTFLEVRQRRKHFSECYFLHQTQSCGRNLCVARNGDRGPRLEKDARSLVR